MYSFSEIFLIIMRCKTIPELEKACAALLYVIEDGDLPINKCDWAKKQSHIRLRQLIT